MRKTILLPASVGTAVLLACVVALLAALAAAPGAFAASRDHGASFAVRCDFSHQLPDDPIVHPDEPGAAHSHDFLGNRSTDAFSTYESMTAPGVTTTCKRPEDTAGYWLPTVSWKDRQGTHELTPTRAVFYYRAGDKAHTTVEPFAKDLRIIADKGVNGARIRWYCGVDDDKAGSPDPPTRCSSGVLGLKIVFPDCVDEENVKDPNLKNVDEVVPGNNYRTGALITTDPDPRTGLVKVIDPDSGDPDTGQVIDSFDDDPDTPEVENPDTPDHRLHMARSKPQNDGTRACSNPDYPIPVPTLTINANFPMPTISGQVTLSSDHDPGDPPGSSMHTDFWNTWDQDAPWSETGGSDGRHFGGLKVLVENCINAVPPTDPRPEPCQAPTATA
jgi:hypothetical protein